MSANTLTAFALVGLLAALGLAAPAQFAKTLETYTPDSEEAIMGEHQKYWKEQGVVLKDPENHTNDKHTPPTHATDFKSATWNGKPTVLHYFHVGPFGKSGKSILVTLWASPEGNDQHVGDLQKIYDSITVKE